MNAKWLDYYARVKKRVHIDRSFFRSAIVVIKLYMHFKWGSGKQTFSVDANRPSLAFFPYPAGPWYNIWLVLQNTKLHLVKDIDKADYIFIFDDATHSHAAEALPENTQATLINHRITDISKSHVSNIFETVFGYNLEVDPTKFIGKAVEKSDENGTHDGRLITCPIPLDAVNPDCCYQKFIDSSFTEKTSEDLRILCVFNHVAAVFHKHKAFEKQFGTDYLSTTVYEAGDQFSTEELTQIAKFCDVIGLDFGAIDVMRDKHDGRIYIVDVNKTCMPVLSLTYPEQYRSLAMIADMFEQYLPPPNGQIE